MIIVECIKEDWMFSPILKELVDDGLVRMPRIGERFKVNEYIHLNSVDELSHIKEAGLTKYAGYGLAEYEWTRKEFKVKIGFRSKNFKVVKNEFEPDGNNLERVKLSTNYSLDINDINFNED